MLNYPNTAYLSKRKLIDYLKKNIFKIITPKKVVSVKKVVTYKKVIIPSKLSSPSKSQAVHKFLTLIF